MMKCFFPYNLGRTKRAKLDLDQENSYISSDLQNRTLRTMIWMMTLTVTICMISISHGGITATHLFLVVNKPRCHVYIGNDILYYFAIHMDLINYGLWTRLRENSCSFDEHVSWTWGTNMNMRPSNNRKYCLMR